MPIVDGKTLIGWGTVREVPWHFVELYASQAEAQAMATLMGEGYIARYGERQTDPDTFPSAQPQRYTAMPGSMFQPLPAGQDHTAGLAAVADWIDDHLANARSS